MTKLIVNESRFDFRGGRNTAVSPDLLDKNELVDATNARLVESYGAFTKRSGTQRIHASAFPATINGVFQWDVPSGKQTVVISNGDLYWRNGQSFTPAFTKAASSAAARTTANQGAGAGWTDPDGTNDGRNTLTRISDGTSTVADASRLVNKLGDPAVDNNLPAADNRYTMKFIVTADASIAVTGTATVFVQLEYSLNSGGAWTQLPELYGAQAGPGQTTTHTYNPTIMFTAAGSPIWIRPILSLGAADMGVSDTVTATVRVYNTAYLTDNFPVTWSSGTSRFSLTEPAMFATFRGNAAGAPLNLYIASGGHYFKWTSSNVLTQLDPTNAAPTATNVISYHTRMFAMMASTVVPGLLPKTVAWSKIGDPEQWTVTGLKSDGGAAVTDFLTGQQLTALEVIGSSLLMATIDSVMRFTGQSSDDIVISQNTEGVSAEVGAVGIQALRRFENVAGMLAQRGPYAVTETAAIPIGEKVLPDFDALDSTVLSNSIVIYNRGRKELLFIVPGAADSALNKTIYAYSTRLQTWYGPWTYNFAITCASNYVVATGIENVVVGCTDGFVRCLDAGEKDDLLYNASGGSNITMTVELPVLTKPGVTVALNRMALQATLPSGSALQLKTSFDGAAFTIDNFTSASSEEYNYRMDLDGQGKRLRMQFVDASAVSPTVNGFVLEAHEYGRP